LIAGAAEGIGYAFSEVIAGKGLNLVMIDYSLDLLQKAADKIRSEYPVEVRMINIDLNLPEASEFLLQSTEDINCRLLIYVAAYSKVKPFLANSKEELDTYVGVNGRTPVQLIHGFATRLNAKEISGGILLLSSLAGLLGPPLVAPYAATKGFQIRLAESLSSEFKGVNIDITACCAGLTSTPTYHANTPERTRNKIKPMDPIRVAEYALRNLGRKTVCIPGWKNRFNYFMLLHLFPRSISLKILAKTMGKMYK